MKRIQVSAPTSERRDERIDEVIGKYWSVLYTGDSPFFSHVDWDEVDGQTNITLWCRQDSEAAQIASELRGCGCVVVVGDNKERDP